MNNAMETISKLNAWVEQHDYKGYEPFDGLSSFLHVLTFKNWFAERVLQQAVRRFPMNIRPLIGVKPQESTKGMGFMARGYIKLWESTKDSKWKDKAKFCLDWLINNTSNNYTGACWGNHFDYASRAFQLPRFVPIVVWTAFIGHVFLDAYESFGDQKYLETAADASRFIWDELPREKKVTGICISYVPFKQLCIHNANMLGGALLARAGVFLHKDNYIDLSNEAFVYSCSCQLDSGAWYYGEEQTYHWIDNWHTGYNLDSLRWYFTATGDPRFLPNMKKGLKFFKENFFETDGKPKYYHNKPYLVDIQCAAQAIDTLSFFSSDDEECLELAKKTAEWTIRNMQDKSGYFYYRKLKWKNMKVPTLHWGQATMFSALSHFYSKINLSA
jgi:polysaccharide biosynthesis protein VpsJ